MAVLALLVATSARAAEAPPAAATPVPLSAISFPTKIQIFSEARYGFGYSVADVGPWMFVGSPGEIARFRVVDIAGRPAFRYEATITMPAPESAFHVSAVGMWIAAAQNHLYAGRGRQPVYGSAEYNATSDIAHLVVSESGEPEFVDWLGVPEAGVVRTDGATLVAPLPMNGWASAPTTPGLIVCPLAADGAPTAPSFVGLPEATSFCRAADVSGEWIAVGLPNATAYGLANVGRVGLLRRDRDGAWAVQQWILPPLELVATDGRFGYAVAIDGATLVVGAPDATHPNPALRGGAALYRLDRQGSWALHSIVGPAANSDHTGVAVEVDGDLIAVGANGKYVAQYGDGSARLFRFHDAGLEPLLTVAHGQSDPNTGRAVSFLDCGGESFFAVSSGPRAPGSDSNSADGGAVVHLRNLSRELADCDEDGVPDGAAIDAGVADDCNRDRVPDACQLQDCDANGSNDVCETAVLPGFDPTPPPLYSYRMWWNNPPVFGHLSLQRSSSPANSSGVVTSVVVEAGRLTASAEISLLLYGDSNQDGDPSDATLLCSVPLDIPIDQSVASVVACPPTVIGPPGTTFFAGVFARGPHTKTFHFDSVSAGSCFYLAGAVASIDLEHPSASQPLLPMVNPNGTGVRMAITPLFRAVADVDGDLVPDACDCPGDLDASGTVDAADLAIVIGAWGQDGRQNSVQSAADIDGDGSVGAFDLSILLSMWGGCA